MWNLSYRWQQQARVGAGIAVLVGAVVAALGLSHTSAAVHAWNGLEELAGEIRQAGEHQIDVAVPGDLETRVGTLVYSDREDGVAQVVGRVVDMRNERPDRAMLTIRLMGPLAEHAESGGVVRGARAGLKLHDAMRLLVTPNTPAEEALLARDAIWPSVTQHVLPSLTTGLIREVSQELTNLDDRDSELVASTFRELQQELKPLEDELVNRLARRAWDVVGVKGLATGVWNATAGHAQNRGATIVQWWWQTFGKQPTTPSPQRPIFSEEMNTDLQNALKDEAVEFWREHREAIVAAASKVFAKRRPDFEAAFRDRWADKLFERAIVPAWQAGQQPVLEAVQVYAQDFAARRLLTKGGGPRLMFAFALRSTLDISDDPLLIFTPGTGEKSGRVEYEPLLR